MMRLVLILVAATFISTFPGWLWLICPPCRTSICTTASWVSENTSDALSNLVRKRFRNSVSKSRW